MIILILSNYVFKMVSALLRYYTILYQHEIGSRHLEIDPVKGI
ncbi:MAG: hypothetical protein R2727_06650 [Bacteroidales bacterium]